MPENTKIHIIDQDPLSLEEILKLLDTKYTITKSSRLENINNKKESPPNVVILNPKLENDNDFKQLYKSLENQLNGTPIYIILLIDKVGSKDFFNLFASDYYDYIEKPITKHVLDYKIKRGVKLYSELNKMRVLEEDKARLLTECNNLKQKLLETKDNVNNILKERAYKEEDLQKHNSELQKDITLTSKLQKNFLPQIIPECSLYKIYTRYHAIKEIGGDFYDFLKIKDNKLGVLIGDVSGHGIASAFIKYMVKRIVSEDKSILENSSELFYKLNENLTGRIYNHFVTAFYSIFNLEEQELKYVSAGHVPTLLYKKSQGMVYTLKAQSTVMGILNNVLYPETTVSLQRGDRILFITDGLIEVFNEKKEQYGLERLIELFNHLNKTSKLSPDLIIDHIIQTVLDFSFKKEFKDDVAIIFIEVN